MATSSYAKSLLGSLPSEIKTALSRAFEYVFDGTLRFGPVDRNRPRTENFAGVYRQGTTHATANTEFSIAHGLGVKPSILLPVLDLNTIGSQMVPLTVSRATDAHRIYLTSGSTSATFTVYVE